MWAALLVCAFTWVDVLSSPNSLVCVGGIVAGFFADRYGAPAITCVVMLYIAVAAVSLRRKRNENHRS